MAFLKQSAKPVLAMFTFLAVVAVSHSTPPWQLGWFFQNGTPEAEGQPIELNQLPSRYTSRMARLTGSMSSSSSQLLTLT